MIDASSEPYQPISLRSAHRRPIGFGGPFPTPGNRSS